MKLKVNRLLIKLLLKVIRKKIKINRIQLKKMKMMKMMRILRILENRIRPKTRTKQIMNLKKIISKLIKILTNSRMKMIPIKYLKKKKKRRLLKEKKVLIR